MAVAPRILTADAFRVGSERILGGLDSITAQDTAAAAAVVVPRDGPALWAVPLTTPEFLAMTLAGGDARSVWSCQDANTALVDARGIMTLPGTGAELLYRQAIAGWTRLRCGLGAVSTNRWEALAGAGWDIATQSVTWLMYWHGLDSLGSTRFPWNLTRSNAYCDYTAGGTIRIRTVSGSGSSVAPVTTADVAMMACWNRAATTFRCWTTTELITSVWYPGAVDAAKGLGAVGGGGLATPLGGCSYMAAWVGAAAEAMDSKTEFSKFVGALPY